MTQRFWFFESLDKEAIQNNSIWNSRNSLRDAKNVIPFIKKSFSKSIRKHCSM